MADFQSPFVPGLPRFTGGAVGYSATTPRRGSSRCSATSAEPADGADEAGFMLFDTVLAFDHVQHRILIIANARITADDDLESLYQFACAKIEFLERELERALSQPSAGARRRRSTSRSNRHARGVRGAWSGRRRSTSPPATSTRSCCRSASRPTSTPIRSPSTARCATSTRRRTCTSSAWASVSIVGSSPEMLVRVEGPHVETHPIAGTRPRGTTDEEDMRLAEELKRNEKERAEHVMLVDLGRNDVGRVCEYGTRARADSSWRSSATRT